MLLIWGLLPGRIFEATPSRASESALFAKLNRILFIINLHAKEEKFVIDNSCTLYTTSVNYQGAMSPVPSVNGPEV